MVKHIIVCFFSMALSLLLKNQRAWSAIDDLVEDGALSDIAGICGEEKECIRGWKTQRCS